MLILEKFYIIADDLPPLRIKEDKEKGRRSIGECWDVNTSWDSIVEAMESPRTLRRTITMAPSPARETMDRRKRAMKLKKVR